MSLVGVVVRLTPLDILDALEHAKVSFRRYQGHPGHYDNKLQGHLVGRIGEMAAESWFRQLSLPVVAHWRDPDSDKKCDLVVAGCRIEMKTWSLLSWEESGRSVAVSQLSSVEDKADVVVWAAVETRLSARRAVDPVDVGLRGCSTLSDIRSAPVKRMACGPDRRLVDNHQVAVMRSFSGLVEHLLQRVR